MVLEEGTNSRDLFESDDHAPSDGNESSRAMSLGRVTADASRTVTDASMALNPDDVDIAYRLNGGPLRQYRIRFDRMPLRGPVRSFAFGSPVVAKYTSQSLVDIMTGMEALIKRPLTQTEAEAVAQRVSERYLYAVAGVYGGLLAGAFLTFQKRKTFKFPLRKPKPVERYNSFPFQRVPLLTGPYARAAWHVTRGLAYVGLSMTLVVPFWDYAGRNMQAMNMMRDERTKLLSQEFSQSLQNRRRIQQMGRAVPANQVGSQSPPTTNGMTSESNGDGDYSDGSQGSYMEDHGSPTPPQYPDSATSSNTGVLSDAQMQSRNQSQRSSSSSFDPSNRNTFDLEKVDRQPRSFDSEYRPSIDSSTSSSQFFDDTSPTTGNDPYDTGAAPNSSAWSRIRQSANSTSSPSSGPAQTSYPPVDPTNKRGIVPPGMRSQTSSARQLQQKSARDEYETSGDSFSFSKEGEQRQLAKEQAQKEFDRMVEAERRGEGGGDIGGGGSASGGTGGSWGRRRGS